MALPDRVEPYDDRRHGGVELARHLVEMLGQRADVVVLALPRGGVPVACEVARALPAPLDVFLVRKLGFPGRPELAMGAIASGGLRVVNEDVVSRFRIPLAELDRVTRAEQIELERREHAYRENRPRVSVEHRVVILVDDGLATGATMRAAVQAVRMRAPERIIVASPVGAPDTCRDLARVADRIVCPWMPAEFAAVGEWYRDFPQMTDEDVCALLTQAPGRAMSRGR